MATLDLHTRHERQFEQNRFVYPVLSRRAGGISLGVNLNPDKRCNFDCIYCQVDRRTPGPVGRVAVETLAVELDTAVRWITSGGIYQTDKFQTTPAALRHLRDIALSGDGEPTACPQFEAAVQACADVKARYALDHVKIVLITNASMLHRSAVQRGLQRLDAHEGEIWAKLDAGTESYYRRVARTTIPFQRILDNITAAARARPIVIQTLLMRIGGKAPPAAEQEAYCRRLREITAAGGRIRLVQITTIARRPAESCVAPLADAEVDAVVQRVRETTGLNTAGFYGSSAWD